MAFVYSQSQPRARKQHKCRECRGVIAPGELYHNIRGLWDGEWDGFKVCLDCEELRILIDAGVPYDEATAFGQLHESIFDGSQVKFMHDFIQTKEKRGAEVPDWMKERLAEAVAQRLNPS